MTVRWKIYDLTRDKHGAKLSGGDYQRRWFTAGVDDIYTHWTDDHRYTLDVAQKIVDWRNEWEDRFIALAGLP